MPTPDPNGSDNLALQRALHEAARDPAKAATESPSVLHVPFAKAPLPVKVELLKENQRNRRRADWLEQELASRTEQWLGPILQQLVPAGVLARGDDAVAEWCAAAGFHLDMHHDPAARSVTLVLMHGDRVVSELTCRPAAKPKLVLPK